MIFQERHQSKSVHQATDVFWECLQMEAGALQAHEPVLASFVSDNLLSHPTFLSALAWRIQKVLEDKLMMFSEIKLIIEKVYDDSPFLIDAAKADLNATMMKDPACHSLCQAFLFLKDSLRCRSIGLRMCCIGKAVSHWLFFSRATARKSLVLIFILLPEWGREYSSITHTPLS